MSLLYNLLVPAKALRWDRSQPMTVENYAWWTDAMRWSMGHVYAKVGAVLLPVMDSMLDAMAPVLDQFGSILDDDR